MGVKVREVEEDPLTEVLQVGDDPNIDLDQIERAQSNMENYHHRMKVAAKYDFEQVKNYIDTEPNIDIEDINEDINFNRNSPTKQFDFDNPNDIYTKIGKNDDYLSSIEG